MPLDTEEKTCRNHSESQELQRHGRKSFSGNGKKVEASYLNTVATRMVEI